MVERNAGQGLEKFTGTVADVVLEKNTFADADSDQYHITIKADGVNVKGKTGFIHEWVRLSAKATQKSVPEGSIVERYLGAIEAVVPEARLAKTLDEAFKLLIGKKFTWSRVKLGRAFAGNPPREMWVPQSLVK